MARGKKKGDGGYQPQENAKNPKLPQGGTGEIEKSEPRRIVAGEPVLPNVSFGFPMDMTVVELQKMAAIRDLDLIIKFVRK